MNKHIVILLLLLGGLHLSMQAEEKYPNALCMWTTNWYLPHVFPMEGTKILCHEKIEPVFVEGNDPNRFPAVTLILANGEEQLFAMWELLRITYEYRAEYDVSNIWETSNASARRVSVYDVNGRLLTTRTLHQCRNYEELLRTFPRGTYIIKDNGRNIKIMK